MGKVKGLFASARYSLVTLVTRKFYQFIIALGLLSEWPAECVRCRPGRRRELSCPTCRPALVRLFVAVDCPNSGKGTKSGTIVPGKPARLGTPGEGNTKQFWSCILSKPTVVFYPAECQPQYLPKMHSNKFFILCIYNFEQKNAYWTTEPQANARLAQSVRTAVKQNKVAQLAFKTIKSGFIKIWSLFCELEEEAKHVNETFKCSARNKEIFLLRCGVRLGVKEGRNWQCSHYRILSGSTVQLWQHWLPC